MEEGAVANHERKSAGRSPLSNDVALRDVTEDDLLIFFEHQLDPDATHMAAFPVRDRNTFMAHWTQVLGDENIIKKTILFNARVAGNIVCFEHSGKREVGYWVGKEYWGRALPPGRCRSSCNTSRCARCTPASSNTMPAPSACWSSAVLRPLVRKARRYC